MEGTVIVLSVVLLAAFLQLDPVSSENQNDEKSMDIRDTKRKSTALWFGPRLGRRKRNPNGEDSYRSPALEKDQLDALMDVIQESPWAIVAVNGLYKGKRRHTVNFTPRLGRESGEDFNSRTSALGGTAGDHWLQDSELSGELMTQRSPPFAPRLGRRITFSPRMGRENEFKTQY